MVQRDYILRLIEQLGAVLTELRNRIMGRKVDPARIQDELTGVAGQAGFDLTLVRTVSGETLVMLAAPTGEVEPSRCWLMAEILYLDGLQAMAEGRQEDASTSLAKADLLFGLIEPGGAMLVGFPEAAERKDEIRGYLDTLQGTTSAPGGKLDAGDG